MINLACLAGHAAESANRKRQREEDEKAPGVASTGGGAPRALKSIVYVDAHGIWLAGAGLTHMDMCLASVRGQCDDARYTTFKPWAAEKAPLLTRGRLTQKRTSRAVHLALLGAEPPAEAFFTTVTAKMTAALASALPLKPHIGAVWILLFVGGATPAQVQDLDYAASVQGAHAVMLRVAEALGMADDMPDIARKDDGSVSMLPNYPFQLIRRTEVLGVMAADQAGPEPPHPAFY